MQKKFAHLLKTKFDVQQNTVSPKSQGKRDAKGFYKSATLSWQRFSDACLSGGTNGAVQGSTALERDRSGLQLSHVFHGHNISMCPMLLQDDTVGGRGGERGSQPEHCLIYLEHLASFPGVSNNKLNHSRDH